MVSWPVMYKSDYENGCLKIFKKKKQHWILIKKWAKDRKKKNSQIE